MIVLWFVLGVICGAGFGAILMAMLFMAKRADENVTASKGYQGPKVNAQELVHHT